jgi:3-dehydroquinate synthase
MVQKKKSVLKNIYIGTEALSHCRNFLNQRTYQKYVILCDQNTQRLCLPLLLANCPVLREAEIIEIEAGESSKCLEVALQVWHGFLEQKAGKHSLLINLGGGVVSDLGGFCASVYKRGIDVINIPTSLLAMVDASVGSKTGIDFGGVKNSIGTYHEPKAVFIDPIFILTLPPREMKNGLAEAIKMALIADKTFWLAFNKPNTAIDDKFISRALTIKAKIVAKDPFDKGIRQSLNYGHSIGHALEALFAKRRNPLLHGEAIVMGMIIENHLAYQIKLLGKKECDLINAFLIHSFKPLPLSRKDAEACLSFLNHDKKNTANELKFSLLTGIGACKTQVSVGAGKITKALQYYCHTVK